MNKLRPNCLNFIELLAQNVALISPTMTAALIVPLMFSTTGNLSWLSYALGMVMLLFVAFNLNQFAKRSTNSGSMYTYATSGLGFGGGALCGWCLVWAYLFIGLAGTTGFTIFAGKLLDMAHISAPAPLLFAVCLGACFMLAYFDIKISTLVMLALEAFSCFFIIVLCMIVLGKHHFAPDMTQFTLKGASMFNLGLGVVVAVFSLVGFESSTAFGEEAKDPLKTIPRTIIWSLVITGLFFMFVCYTEVLGIQGYKDTLDKVDAPLNVLSVMYGVPFLSPLLSAGAMFSFFALALSCMNAGARVMFSMGRHDFFPKSTSTAHSKFATPHVALGVMAIVMFIVVIVSKYAMQLAVLDEFNDAGTMGAFGFVGAYFLVSLAAPFYLKKRGEVKIMDWGLSGAALVLLLIPMIGSVYPVPAAPVNAFPYVFAIYLFFGALRVMAMQHQKPARVEEIHDEVKKLHVATA